ncbi:hypothetical protein [Providencia phage PSTCR6]|nr:hypothetical protein [Providencia phage PSTCR6]
MFNTDNFLELQRLMKKEYSRDDDLKTFQKRKADEQRRRDEFNSYRLDESFSNYIMTPGGIMGTSSFDDHRSSSSSSDSSTDSSSYDSGSSFDSSF